MINEQKEEIFQFLAGNWYSRPENDFEIVKDILRNISPEKLRHQLDLIRDYLADPVSIEDKNTFIRGSVQRYIPEGIDAPIVWLKKISHLLDVQ